MLGPSFVFDGRRLHIIFVPTLSAFRFSIWEGSRKVSQTDIVVEQSKLMTADQMEECLHQIEEDVRSGRILLLPP